MFKPYTYLDLCMAMKTRAVVQISSYIGVINGITAEDGSGRNWNIKLHQTGPKIEDADRVISIFFADKE